jgi:site-specific recombinase XerD
VAAATQNQALSALLWLNREVIGAPLPWLDELDRAKGPKRVPTVLTRAEVERLLLRMRGSKWLMASLLYGAGLRLRECLKLRVKDVDFGYRQILALDGKGAKDRVTMLPGSLVDQAAPRARTKGARARRGARPRAAGGQPAGRAAQIKKGAEAPFSF